MGTVTAKGEMESALLMMATYHREIGEAGLPALLLEKGTWFEGRADSDGYAVTKKWKKKNKPKAQDCFYNSQVFCAEVGGSRYFEGYVHIQEELPPAEHCWVVMQDGRVVDFTLEAMEVIAAERGHAVELQGALYVGVEVPSAIILERLADTEWYEPIAEWFYADHLKAIADVKIAAPPRAGKE